MSIQRVRPIDTLENILSSFKQFEKKLDKLQDDVNYHGHTLSELHVMIANISGGNILNNFKSEKLEEMKKLVNKTTAMHPDSNFYHEKPIKTKRRGTMQPPPSKMISKSFQGPRNRVNDTRDVNPNITKTSTCPKIVLGAKRVPRQRKGEAPRKSMKLRKEDKDSLSP